MAAEKLKIDIRRARILEQLRRDGRVTVAQLSEALGATQVTIRNDLDALERDGQLRRVSGGAVRADAPAAVPSGPADELAEVKDAIAAAAAERIRDGDTLFINSGTTTRHLAAALRRKKNLNVVTNSLAVALALGETPTFRVLLLGGEINVRYGFTCGGDAQEQLRRYQADWAILSVDGYSAAGGLTTYHAEEAILNRMMIAQARRTMIAADHTKIGRAGFSHICPAGKEQLLVTDRESGGDALRALEESGVEILFG